MDRSVQVCVRIVRPDCDALGRTVQDDPFAGLSINLWYSCLDSNVCDAQTVDVLEVVSRHSRACDPMVRLR